jgi:biotin carboxyl carrier protein
MKHLRITVEGKAYDVTVENLDGEEASSPAPQPQIARTTAAAAVTKPKAAPKAAVAPGDVTSPIAGIVKSVDVAVGAQVKAGDPVVTLEAMKMYTAINAPAGGTVTAILVKVGDAVDEDQALYTLS